MRTRSLPACFSILAIVTFGAFGAGCTAAAESSEDDSVLQNAEALSAESTGEDPVEEGVVSDEDVSGASDEAAEARIDAPEPLDVGCGVRRGLRQRIKDHFDGNGDGKLDESERADLKDAVDGAPRMRPALLKLGIRARHHVWKRIRWAYDTNNDGTLDDGERDVLLGVIKARCEAKKARVLEAFDANDDGTLDDGELRAALRARMEKMHERRDDLFARVDTNGDGVVDEAERAAAREIFIEHYRTRRDEIKAKFDVNGDGKLDESEIAALKAAIRARFESGPQSEE